MIIRFTALLAASAALAACSGGDAAGTGDSAAAACDMNVPPEDRTTGRVMTDSQRRRAELGEDIRVSWEMGRLAKACAERAGFTEVGNMQLRRPGPTVLAADGSRGPTTENTWSTVGMRDGVRTQIVVDFGRRADLRPARRPLTRQSRRKAIETLPVQRFIARQRGT